MEDHNETDFFPVYFCFASCKNFAKYLHLSIEY